MPIQESCEILSHDKVGPHYFLLTLASQNIAKSTTPGQFVNVKVSEGIIPLLRRPLSIHRRENDRMQLLYEVIGSGTEALSKRKTGEKLSLLGPLGNGYQVEKDDLLLVAGGMGIAPLRFLAEETVKQKKNIKFLIGSKSREFVMCEPGLKDLGCEVLFATEDGSYGEKGLVTDLLIKTIATGNSRTEAVYACGPHAMLKAVAGIARGKKISCQVSLEAYMACGLGACLGCAVETIKGYKMVCKDGPVFDAEEIKW